MAKITKSDGFSLVEVVVFLAISGMILIIVFFAVRQANRNNQDDARTRDVGRYLTAMQQWINDNNGNIPDSTGNINGLSFQDPANGVAAKYITTSGATFTAPDGTPWLPTWASGTQAPGPNPELLVAASATCNSSGSIVVSPPGAHLRQIAVAVQLNGGQAYCVSK